MTKSNNKKSAEKCSEGNIVTSPLSEDSKKKFSRFCFTSFQEDPPPYDEKRMKWLIYGPEKTEGGQHHWQGYLVFNKGFDCTISACSKKLGKITVLPSMGSPEENLAYIKGPYTKGDKHKPANPDFVEFGEMPQQGARRDLDELKDRVMTGTRVDEICKESPIMVHQYGRVLDRLEDIYLRDQWRTKMTRGIWLYGSTGKGKTHYWNKVLNYHPDTHYLWQKDEEFQCDYRQQPVVVIDEFRAQIPFGKLLELVNDCPYNVKRKNRAPMPFKSDVVVVTSPTAPEVSYSNALGENDGNWAQFMRRFKVYNLDAGEYPGNPVQKKLDEDFDFEWFKEVKEDPFKVDFVDDMD